MHPGVSLVFGVPHEADAAGHPVQWHGQPVAYEDGLGNTWYDVPYKAGTLEENGKFTAFATGMTPISEDGIDFYFAVADRYISSVRPAGAAAKIFDVTGTYIQDTGTLSFTFYGISVKGQTSLTGAPAKVYKSSSKVRKSIGKAIGIANAAVALRKVRGIIKSLKKVEAFLEKEAKKEKAPGATDISGWLHPSMIKSPQKALSLAERAARTPEQKARDRTLEQAQTQIDKLNRKLEKLGN